MIEAIAIRLARKTPAAALLLMASRASGQINVEPFRAQLQDDRLGGELRASLVGRAGNTEGITAGGTALVGGRSRRHFAFAVASIDYSRFSGQTNVSRYFTHARYNYDVTAPVVGELFAQLEHDRFQRLTVRRLVGAGPRFELAEGEPLTLALGTAYMLETELLRETAELPGQENTFHRWSNYATLLVQPDDRVTFTTMALFQPRFDAPTDFRLLNVDSLDFAVTPLLTASIAATLRYDSRPPSAVKRFDLEVKNALALKF